jgi:hypothetical protein
MVEVHSTTQPTETSKLVEAVEVPVETVAMARVPHLALVVPERIR